MATETLYLRGKILRGGNLRKKLKREKGNQKLHPMTIDPYDKISHGWDLRERSLEAEGGTSIREKEESLSGRKRTIIMVPVLITSAGDGGDLRWTSCVQGELRMRRVLARRKIRRGTATYQEKREEAVFPTNWLQQGKRGCVTKKPLLEGKRATIRAQDENERGGRDSCSFFFSMVTCATRIEGMHRENTKFNKRDFMLSPDSQKKTFRIEQIGRFRG